MVTPEGDGIRPTGDRVREALFSILGDLHDAVVVDGFAGTGALGCEALSRGAKRCYFFDKTTEAIDAVHENVRRVGLERQAIIRKCAFEFGLVNHVREEPDLWLLDPPYGSGLGAKALEAMLESPHVTEGALVVLESGGDDETPKVEGFELEDERRYGRTRLLFYRRSSGDVVDGENEEQDGQEEQ
ncbi:MAG: 16S rRNA (guanine(966)-N(2))-methyltransferase RsmD [Bradymonadaceae bacterium]|nr:16S rRNA (guanine(966)-N(2))-methyltransferase RsmD [Lujinxingiaceae bacterium]